MPSKQQNNLSKDLLNNHLDVNNITTTSNEVKPVLPPVSIGKFYNRQLQNLIKKVREDINLVIMPKVKSLEPQYVISYDESPSVSINKQFQSLLDKYSSPNFVKIYTDLSKTYVTKIDNKNQDKFNQQMKGFGLNIYGESAFLQSYLADSIAANVKLISTIPQQYLNNVESMIDTNMRAGLRSSQMTKQLTDQFGVTKRRAVFIARDQTNKTNGLMNQKRQISSGFNYFQWLTSKDSNVRCRHKEIADKVTAYGKGIYSWDNLPLSDKGSPIAPGQDYGCRCTASPVPDYQVAENKKKGKTKKGVYK